MAKTLKIASSDVAVPNPTIKNEAKIKGPSENYIDLLFSNATSFQDFASSYFEYLGTLMKQLDLNALGSVVRELEAAREEGRTVFIIGNGGSAATASHMANDIGVGVTRAGRDAKAFRVISLTDNCALMTAVANDLGFEHVFTSQLESQFTKGDCLIVISASGNSRNLLEAVRWVKARGGRVISFVGFDGGEVKPLSDICVQVATSHGEYGPVEDLHMILDHVMYSWLRRVTLHGNKALRAI